MAIDLTTNPSFAAVMRDRRSTYLGYLVLALLLTYFLIATFPGHYMAIQPGLDPSWCYALNYLAHSSEYLFGRDVVFTYGPWGYLVNPVNIGNNILQAWVVRLVLHFLFAALVVYYWWGSRKTMQVALFLAAWLVASILWGWSFDFYITLLICMLVSLALKKPLDSHLLLLLAGVLSAVALFIKFNTGVCAFLLIIATAALLRLTTHSWRPAAIALGAYLPTVAILAIALIGSPAGIAQWLRGSIEISSGYNSTMSVACPRPVLFAGFAVLLLWLGLLAWLLFSRSSLRLMALVFSIAVFVAFKSGFVRQDGHVLTLFLFMLPITGLLILNAEQRRELVLSLAAFLVFLGLAIPVIPIYLPGVLSAQSVVDVIWLKRGMRHMSSLLNFDMTKASLVAAEQASLLDEKLPQPVSDLINKSQHTVGVFPWEISYLPANNLIWRPMPTLQAYTAYTPWLDSLNAQHFAATKAPDFVIVGYDSIDGRHIVLDTPATWRSLMAHYEVAKRLGNGFLLSKKTMPAATLAVETVASDRASFGQWIAVPALDTPLYASFTLSFNLIGKVAKALYKIPEVNIECLYESGRVASYRIAPEVTANGLLLNYLPSGVRDLNQLFSCIARDRVIRFRILGRGAKYFRQSFDLTWQKSKSGPCQAISRPADKSDTINIHGGEDLLSYLPEYFQDTPALRLVSTGLFMHTDGKLEFGPFQASEKLCFNSDAIIDPAIPADPPTDGADFVLSVIPDKGTPTQEQKSVLRGNPQTFQLRLPLSTPFILRLETFRRKELTYDWAIWRSPRFDRCK